MAYDRELHIRAIAEGLRTDPEQRRMAAELFVESGEAKQLMRNAGFGVTGTNLLRTTEEVLERLKEFESCHTST